ncbi:hypothetical protein [Streptomyces sp. NPDC051909]|uniref:hypothetical protein n=1 Tax=Streptomyces sp. NPDC051909 TaxID=3154944 RepID=UPI00341AF4EB
MNKTIRQFALALVACLAVAGGATIAATSSDSGATHQPASAGDEWPVPPATSAPIN